MLKRTNFKLKSKNWSRNKTSSRLFWTSLSHHCWNNFQRPTHRLFWITRSWLTTWKRPRPQQMRFNSNQKSQRSLKSISTHREKSIVLWLLKAPCSTSCVSLSVSSTTCTSIPWRVSSNSSSRLSREQWKRTKLELVSWFRISDIPFINGCQEDFSKSTSWFSCRWLLLGWWTRRLLMWRILLRRWTFWSRVCPDRVLRILLIGCLILRGTWCRRFLNWNSSKSSPRTCRRTPPPDSRTGTMS